MTFINTCQRQNVDEQSRRISHLGVEEEVISEPEECTDSFVEPTIYVNRFYPCGITSYYEQLKKYSKFKLKEISTPEEIKNREISVVVLNDRCIALKNEGDIQVVHFSEIMPKGESTDYQDQIKNCQKIVCVQKRIKDIIKTWMLKDNTKKDIHVIPACYDIPKPNPDLFFNEYGLKDFVLGSGGGDRKRPHLFIELARRNPGENFVLSREKDICPHLPNLYCIGFIPREIYLSAVSACKMFICTSRSEGTPYVILEALSQGKTVISSDYGGELIVEDGKSGYIFDGTVEDLDRVFKHALQHSINGIVRLKEEYYSPKVVKRLDELYSSFYPFVSVCIPNYNGAKFLEQSLKSILTQNYPNIEIIVADSNSNDYSVEILEEYAHSNINIKVIYQPEKTSIAKGLNECLKVTKGKYFIPWHSDDVMSPADSISRRVLEMERRPNIGMIYGILNLIDEKNTVIDTWDREQVSHSVFKHWNPLASPSTMFRMEAVRKVGGYNEEILHGEDYYLNMLVSKFYPILYIPFIVACYRQHQNADSTGRDYTKWDRMIREEVDAFT